MEGVCFRSWREYVSNENKNLVQAVDGVVVVIINVINNNACNES